MKSFVRAGILVTTSFFAMHALADVAKEINDYCTGAYDFDGCKKSAEKEHALLVKYGKFVRRNGRTIEFEPVKGSMLKLSDVVRDGDVSVYKVKDYLQNVDNFLIKISHSEGVSYALVSRYDGYKVDIDSLPLFSPDHDHFITADICPSYCMNRLQVWRRLPHEGHPFELVWSYTPYDSLERIDAAWVDNRSIKLIMSIYEDPDEFRVGTRTSEKVAYLHLDSSGWRLRDRLPSEK